MKWVRILVMGFGGMATLQAHALELVGLVEPHQLVKVGSSVTGIMDAIAVERGDRVERGQLLARLKSHVEAVDVELAKAKHVYLVGQYERARSLVDQSFVSKQAVDQAETEMNVAKLDMERQSILLGNRRIDSPISGVVVKKLLSPGEYVYEQTPVMLLAQINPLNVEVLVPMSHYKKVTKGMVAWVTLDVGADKPQMAKVVLIDKVMDPASGTFGVRLELPNGKLEMPAGQKCKVTFKGL